MRGFRLIARAALAAASLSWAAGALACQPPPAPPPPPPPMPGESEADYRARALAALRAHDERESAELRAGRLRHETRLWDEAAQIIVVEVIEGPRIRKQKPTHRQMEVRLRPVTAVRGSAPARPVALRYRLEFNICGYEDGHHFRTAQPGDMLVLFAGPGKLAYDTLLGGIGKSLAIKDETISLLSGARP